MTPGRKEKMKQQTIADKAPISGLVKERNAYRRLLKSSQYALGVLRDTPINDVNPRGETTRSLAEKIRVTLDEFEVQS